jgi:hypothetical protein
MGTEPPCAFHSTHQQQPFLPLLLYLLLYLDLGFCGDAVGLLLAAAGAAAD